MDEEEKALLNYKPPLSHMKTGLWVLWFVFLIVMVLWTQTETPADPWFTWGGWISFGLLALFSLTPLVISRDSPKISSNKMGSTIASPQPLVTIPAQAAHPAYGIYPAGSVKAWFFFDFVASTRAYVIAPLDLVYVIGEEGNERGKGLNVVVNSPLEVYTDHTQLPPHILEAVQTMRKPGYEPNMPILYNWWPLMVNNLSKKDEERYKEQFRSIGVPEENIEDAWRIAQTASAVLSKFRYEDQLTKMESNLVRREKIVNAENADLKKANAYLKIELEDTYKRLTNWKEPQAPKSIFNIPMRRDDDEEEEYNERRNRRDY